jgi:hypothetical protein
MKNFDIGITTFSLRYDFVENLVKQIRNYTNNNILLTINGEYGETFDEEYRKRILKLCLEHNNIFPIFFTEMRGLSKMWNSLVIHATNKDILILNDDISIESSNIFDVVLSHINSDEYNGLSIINDTFSFFVTNKDYVDDLGYFDERLLGFGEEDGDIMYRIRKKHNKQVDRLYCGDLTNIISDVRHTKVKNGIGKYSLFNREYIFNEKYKCYGDIYYFPSGIECDQLFDDIKLYPAEEYFNKNKNKL